MGEALARVSSGRLVSQSAAHVTLRLLLPTSPLLQVIGQALGGKTFKLKFGHHGGNHPLRHTPTGAHDLGPLGAGRSGGNERIGIV